MGDGQLVKLTERGKALVRLVKLLGPLMLSQSEKGSKAYAAHLLRLAEVQAAREFMVAEANSLADARARLRERYYEAPPDERIRLRRDIEETERDIRRLHIASDAFDKISADHPDLAKESDTDLHDVHISPHWLDKFNEFARARNEPWRSDLLSTALALEAKNPGAIGVTALWLIGTIDKSIFDAYASVLDLSVNLGGRNGHLIPKYGRGFDDHPIPYCALGPNLTIPHLLFMLTDLGVIGDPLSSKKTFPADGVFLAQYGHRRVALIAKQTFVVSAIVPTQLGEAIAKLYTPQPNLLGQEIFEKWINSLSDAKVQKRDVSLEE